MPTPLSVSQSVKLAETGKYMLVFETVLGLAVGLATLVAAEGYNHPGWAGSPIRSSGDAIALGVTCLGAAGVLLYGLISLRFQPYALADPEIPVSSGWRAALIVSGGLLSADAVVVGFAWLMSLAQVPYGIGLVGIVASSLLLYAFLLGNLYLFGLRGSRASMRDLGWRMPDNPWWFASVPVFAFLAIMLSGATQKLNNLFAHSGSGQCATFTGEYHGAAALVALPLLCVVAPIAEETIFRGLIYQSLAKKVGGTAAVIGSAVIFALWHSEVDVFLPLVVVGAILAVAYSESRSLYVSAPIHAIFNFVGFLPLILGTPANC